jgi:hypothetical protein
MDSLGQSGANAIATTTMQGANAVNQQNNNAALATATGYQNQGNIWGQGLADAGNNFSNLYQLQQQNRPAAATASGYNPVGTLNPAFAGTRYGAEPAYTNWAALNMGL